MKSDIEEKIEKLLALSESNNPNEAKAALLKAQELMLKYNISEVDNIKETKICTESIKINRNRFAKRISILIANNFRTKTWISTDCINFMGFKEDVYASKFCFEYLFEESARCFSDYVYNHKESFEDSNSKVYQRYLYRQWMEGFLSGLEDAFESRKSDLEFQIMLTTPEEVLREYNKLSLYSVSLRTGKRLSEEAYNAGYENGKTALDKRSIEENRNNMTP